jgi:hypothetical protein
MITYRQVRYKNLLQIESQNAKIAELQSQNVTVLNAFLTKDGFGIAVLPGMANKKETTRINKSQQTTTTKPKTIKILQ